MYHSLFQERAVRCYPIQDLCFQTAFMAMITFA